jgi:hypothetical protein
LYEGIKLIKGIQSVGYIKTFIETQVDYTMQRRQRGTGGGNHEFKGPPPQRRNVRPAPVEDTTHMVEGGIKLKMLTKDPMHYFNQSTILFGATRSGKSTVLMDILHQLKGMVPLIYVFSPTAEANNTFEGVVPAPLIYTTVDIDRLKRIYARQQGAQKIYNKVNKMPPLQELFEKVASDKEISAAQSAYQNAIRIISKKQNDKSLNKGERNAVVSRVKKVRDEYLVTLYKAVIRVNKARLKKMDLTQTQLYIIKYLDFNPNCIVIFDDFGAELRAFQNTDIVKKIFFQGRHSSINMILTLQDDMGLSSSLRKNAFVSIFTSAQCASAYFARGSNNFQKATKVKAEAIITDLFNDTNKKTHKKLAYMRDELDSFRYTIADIHDDFRFGSSALWDICNTITNGAKKMDFDNDPLLSAFKIDI